jgi:peptidoglycan/LPS O-acetylase OafA/YrhL
VLLFIFFLPNIAFNLNRYPPDTAPLWSIGIEEQFYLVWPLVVSRIRALKTFLCILIVVLVGARASLHAFSGGGKHLATSITDSLGYDSMAVGALLAILYRDGHATLLRVARSWVPHLAFVALVIGLAVNKLRFFSQAGTLVTAVVTGVFIVSQIAGSRKPLDLEQPILNYLGKISFGIYVYHMLVITLVAKLLVTAFPDAVIPTPAIMAIVVASTIAIAGLSYRFFESPFLRFKHSLERVKTSARVP